VDNPNKYVEYLIVVGLIISGSASNLYLLLFDIVIIGISVTTDETIGGESSVLIGGITGALGNNLII